MIPAADKGFWLQRIVNAVGRLVFGFAFAPRVTGRGHVPASGGVILAINHQRLIDPVLLSTYTPRPVYYIAKKELFGIPILGPLIRCYGAFPVDRYGHDVAAVRVSIRAVAENGCVLGIFPEGTRVRDVDLGRVEEGVGLIALRGKAPVIPVHIGRYRFWRRMLIRFGPPIRLEDLMAGRADAAAVTEATARIARGIAGLAHET